MDEKLRAQAAAMESQLSQIESEMGYLDEILRKSGFPDGIKTLRKTVEELLTLSEEKPESKEAPKA